MKRHQYHLMAGECQQQTYLEKIYLYLYIGDIVVV